MLRFAAAMAASVSLAGAAPAASFPCESAKTPIEKMICGDLELSQLDTHLGDYYHHARKEVQSAESCLIDDQKNWLRTRRNACKDAACLRQAYLERLAELDPFQPGASAIRHLELPRVKALSRIIPPAADQVAAPRNAAGKPLIAQGRIVNEIAGGDGYVLHADNGRKHLIMSAMLLDDPTGFLERAAKEKSLRVELRGHGLADSRSGAVNFDEGRCILVYRLPQ